MASTLFAGQFALTRSAAPTPDAWSEQTLSGWTLTTSLPVIDLLDVSGQIGWFVGYPIGEDGVLPSDAVRLPLRASQEAAIEDALYTYGGRFVAVLVTPGYERLYLDSGGTLATVFGRDAVASTPTLLSWMTGSQPVVPKPLLPPDQFFFAGRTPDPEVHRLMPNHYLDLRAGRAVRHHWHISPIPASDKETPQLVDTIVTGLRRNLSALATALPTRLALTAGRDSRMLLACSRSVADLIETFTFTGTRSETDIFVARKLSQRLGIPHAIIETTEPDAALKSLYAHRIGHVADWGMAPDFYNAALAHFDPGEAMLIGYGGELGRASRTQRSLTPTTHVTPEYVLAGYNDPATPETVQALSSWFGGIEWSDSFSFLGQMYWENRMGCWASPHLYGVTPTLVPFVPFVHRTIVDSMARLPVNYRRQNLLPVEIVAREWPRLNRTPYQRKTGVSYWAKRLYAGARRRLQKLGS